MKRINAVAEIDEELFTPIRSMLEIMQGFEETAKDNREEIAELISERIDLVRKYPSAEDKLQNLRQCMNEMVCSNRKDGNDE